MIFAIPSKGRAGIVTTTKFVTKMAAIFCPESEEEDYKKYHQRVMGVPEKIIGITRTRNWILDFAKHNGERRILMMDDDLRVFAKFEKGKPGVGIPVEFERFIHLVSNMFDMAEDIGTNLWGFQVTNDGKTYREYSPFSLQSFIAGHLMGIIDDGQRFDERLRLKEDYDFSLQSLRRHRRVLRFNKYSFYVDHHDTVGGCRTYRTMKMEMDAIEMLRRKWGTELVWTNPKKRYEVRVRSPIGGI